MENIDTNRKTRGGPKKPQWEDVAAIGASTPVGIGALTTAFTLAPAYPGRLALTLDIRQYVLGDDVLIYVEQRADSINWGTLGYIDISNGIIVVLAGPSASLYESGGVAIAALTLPLIQFDIHVDTLLGLRLRFIQGLGGGPRTLNYHYNYSMEVRG